MIWKNFQISTFKTGSRIIIQKEKNKINKKIVIWMEFYDTVVNGSDGGFHFHKICK